MNVTINGLDWLWLVLLYVAGDIGYHIVTDLIALTRHRYRVRQDIRRAAQESDQVAGEQFPARYWRPVDGKHPGK